MGRGNWFLLAGLLGCGSLQGPAVELPAAAVLPACPDGTALELLRSDDVTVVWCETPERLVHGWRASYWQSGQIAMRADYRRGRPDGVVSTWHANGVRSRVSHWVDGIREGRSAEWYESGQLSSTVSFAHGVKQGVQLDYYPSGHPMSRAAFCDGVQEGPLVAWYRDGAKQVIGDYRRGHANGRWFYWDPSGQLDTIIHWRDGVEVSASSARRAARALSITVATDSSALRR